MSHTGTGGTSGDQSERKLRAVATTESATGSASRNSRKRAPKGIHIPRYFTKAGDDPFDSVEWEIRVARIANEKGEVVFEQDDCEIPKSWSQC